MEATRISDGAQVKMKKLPISTTSQLEIDMGRFFSSDSHTSNPANHCVPFYDILEVPDEQIFLIVMPLLTQWEEPVFETVGEVVEFFRQLFEVRCI